MKTYFISTMPDPKLPFNPFSGILHVIACEYPCHDGSWVPDPDFVPGEDIWDFGITEAKYSPDGKLRFEGKLEGYTGSSEHHRVEFVWMPDNDTLYIDHIISSPYGYTDIFNETFAVELAEGKALLTLYEDEEPAIRWGLLAG